MCLRLRTSLSAILLGLMACASYASGFKVEEATIDGLHSAIQKGNATCQSIVEAYIERARAYNGVCTALVTRNGEDVAPVLGQVRAGEPLKFPTTTVAMRDVVPAFDKYQGPTPDYGRMEPTISDPSVQQQYGMVVGIANAGQVNALETLNLRGERSVSCKAECDTASGALPKSCPKACETLRKHPDALEVAAALDKKYGKNPDLEAMPLYCVPMSFKAVFDAKDMRSIGGGDVNYAMDVPVEDSTLVKRMRDSGAIIYAKANNSEYNGGAGNPGGDAKVEHPQFGRGGSRETWGGAICNPYDTTRETGGSSGGSGASVAANLVMCSICETTGGSCRNPANYNGVVNVVPSKGMISFGGGIGANPFQDRPGINCRSVKDAAMVLDAFRDRTTGKFFDERDHYTALTRIDAAHTPYLDALVKPGTSKPLAGMRIGVVREFFVKHTPFHNSVSDGINKELKVLQKLGAELVETLDVDYPDDPSIANMEFTFQHALAETIPFHMPEILSWTVAGKPEFAVDGWDVTSRDYLVAASIHKAPWPSNLDLQRIISNGNTDEDSVSGYHFAWDFARYLMLRGDARVYDWKTLNDNAKYFSDHRRAAMKNWENKAMDPATNAITHTMKRRYVLRLALLKVLEQNNLDALVSPSDTAIASKIGGAAPPDRPRFGYGATMGIAEVYVPAGFSSEVFEPRYILTEDAKDYATEDTNKAVKLASPMPFNIGFWSGPEEMQTLLKIGSAYEQATRHRKPPAAFGPLSDSTLSAR